VTEEEEDEPKNLYAFLIKNGLTQRAKRKRGDPIEVAGPRREFKTRNRANNSEAPLSKSKPFSKIQGIREIYERTDIETPPMAVINSRINEYFTKQNTKEYINSFLH